MVDMVFLVFVGFLYPPPAWENFSLRQEKFPKRFLPVVVVYASFFSERAQRLTLGPETARWVGGLPEKCFQELISEKLLILLRDRPCLESIIVSSNFQAFLFLPEKLLESV